MNLGVPFDYDDEARSSLFRNSSRRIDRALILTFVTDLDGIDSEQSLRLVSLGCKGRRVAKQSLI